MPPDDNDLIEDFKAAVWETWARDGKTTWPIDINSATPLFMDVFFEEFRANIATARERGFDDRAIAAMLKTPQRIIRVIMPVVQGMKRLRIPRQEQREHVLFLLSLVRHMKHGDPLNRDGKNLILSPTELDQSVDVAQLRRAGPSSAATVRKLCGVLWAYSEAVCFRAHGISKEFHGPYAHPALGGDMVLRDYFCLAAVELWPDCSSVPYREVRVISVYDDLGLTVDLFNHFTVRSGSGFVQHSRHLAVLGDGRYLNMKEIEGLCSTLLQVMRSIIKTVEEMSWSELAYKYAEIFWYGLKDLKDLNGRLNLHWRPPGTVEQRIMATTPQTTRRDLGEIQLKRMLRLAL